MNVSLSSQPPSKHIYYGVRLYDKNGKYIGSHNGLKKTKKIQWFAKEFLDMFIEELQEKAKNSNVKVVIEKKSF